MIMNIVRIAKVVALLAFVLPWVAVSCNGTDLATATGIELIQGTMSENPQAGQQMAGSIGLPADGESTQDGGTSEMPPMQMNFFALAAAIVIAIGLGLTFIGRAAPMATLVISLVAGGLVYGATLQFRQEVMNSEMAQEQSGGGPSPPLGASDDPFAASMQQQMGQMGQMASGMIQVQERIGFWVVLGGLLVAAGASGIALATRRGGASVRPDSM
jgi:hypothetical protein